MSKLSVVSDNPKTQMDLFPSKTPTAEFAAGSFRRREALQEALHRALSRCPLSREEIAAELTRLVGEEVSVHTINNWLAESKSNRKMPLEYAEAFAAITGDDHIIEIAFPRHKTLGAEDAAYYELGKIIADEKRRAKKKRDVFERIGI
jgi:hypothetical protein